MALDPITGVLELATAIVAAIDKSETALATGNPELYTTYVDNKLKVLIKLQDMVLAVIEHTKGTA